VTGTADGRTGDERHSAASPEGTINPEGSLSLLDQGLYALFARHADRRRHENDRHRYRGTDLRVSFDLYLARTYAASWIAALVVATTTLVVVTALPRATVDAVTTLVPAPAPEGADGARLGLAVVSAVVAAAGAKRATIAVGSLLLRWRASARRTNIERTLPGAARYLRALSAGSDDRRAMLRKVADNDAYGETAVSIRKALNTAALTGSLADGLRRVARDTPSNDALAPFLLKFREHAAQGEDALAEYLEMESRMLGHRQDRARQRAEGFLEVVAELFIVLLVVPALLVIVLTVMSVLAPGLAAPVPGPFTFSIRAGLVYGSAAFVLTVGVGAALTVDTLRPADQRVRYQRPQGLGATIATALTNPASAATVFVLPAVGTIPLVLNTGSNPVNAVLLGYVAYALPVGSVAIRRARRDDAKDREMADFVHAVSGHVSLGRPFPEAVALVSEQGELGPLDPDVADLAFNLATTTRDPTADEIDVRRAALDRFVDRVGTPLAEQSIGLVTGALDAGSDTEAVFETLQTEIGRLYHEKQALRSNMLVYATVGWTTALLVIGITIAVNTHVLDGFAQLSALSGSSRVSLNPDAIQPARDRFRFYVVTQATMLASGWFAGAASRGTYEALLHSGALVTVCYLVFAGAGMI
jgi:archaellum biogenesis protein FlaJ (TadC family)